ncbi:MAG: glycoside hydrolase family 32 protein [Prolixibacteraceae bacterium]
MKKIRIVFVMVAGVFLLSASRPTKGPYDEKYRPQYHFTVKQHYMGMPAGMVYLDGEYHLFYQYNPDTTAEGFSHLGHASGKDLVRWEEHPAAIVPDNTPGDSGFCTALPGSAIVDHRNLLGLQTGDTKTMVLFYTGKGCGQRMAYSTDKGKTWQKYAGNPVIPYDETDEASYPKVFWHEQTEAWVMVLYRKPELDERKQGFSFYTSTNLTQWKYQSHIAGFNGKPDIAELRVNNRPDDVRWILMEGNGDYVIGSFDGTAFKPESIRLKSDYGKKFTGPVNCGNIPASDGRTLQVALVKNEEWPGMPFHGQMTFPSELSLKKTTTGTFLFRTAAKEIEKLPDKQYRWKDEKLIPGIGQNLIKKVKGDRLRITGRFDLKNCDSFGFMLRAGKKNPGTELVYNVKRNTLSLMGMTIPLEPVDNKIYLDILIDRASVEVFANNGRSAISGILFAEENHDDYLLYNTGGELQVEELEISTLRSIREETE